MHNSFKQRVIQYVRWWLKKTQKSPKITNFIVVSVLCVGLIAVTLFDEKPAVQPSKEPFSHYPTFLTCTVDRVIDGDSVITKCPVEKGGAKLFKRSVRIFGIDAPEIGQKPWGDLSTQTLVGMIEKSQTIELEFLEQDRYQRFIAKIYIDGIDIGLEMVKQGAASVYHRYNKEQDYINAEKKARMMRSGIWEIKGAHQNPEKWRRFNP